jgi:hypothetical protein
MFLVVRVDRFQVIPESFGMILFFNMDKLMNQDVIDDAEGSHDHSPAKR